MSSPKLPISESYWKSKGKVFMNNTYKNVMLFTHDDLDGIYSAIAMKNILKTRGYNILGYGILNYQQAYRYTTLNPEIINIAVDFSNDNDLIDIFVDHHEGVVKSDKKSIKMKTCSAFEAINYQYDIPNDGLVLNPIDMVDSAKYEEYRLSFTDTMYFGWDRIKSTRNPKMALVAFINQILKRSDYNTLIEVIHNCKTNSFYEICSKLKEYYPGNNLEPKTFKRKGYIEDGIERLEQVKKRTRGDMAQNKQYFDQKTLIKENFKEDIVKFSGYKIIGNLMFIPSGTWANAIRARAILEEDRENGIITYDINYILLQYGSTLQMVKYKDSNTILKNGNKLDDIAVYMGEILNFFKDTLNYNDPSTYIIGDGDEITKSGGHSGIGSITNICGKIGFEGKYMGMKYLDLFKNKIIQDVCGIDWKDLTVRWTGESSYKPNDPEMDYMIKLVDTIRTSGEQKTSKEFESVIK